MPQDLNHIRRFKIVDNRRVSARIFTLTLEPEVTHHASRNTQHATAEPDTFKFKPGQYVMLHLLNEDGTTWKAPFSLANAPDAADGRLELTIKIYKDFTARASKLAPGDVVGIQGPYGVFVPDEQAASLVLLASGIGITPFVSVIRDLVRRKSTQPVTLFYSVREPENFVFREEFERLAQEWPNFKPVFILTGEPVEEWTGERGRLDETMFDRHVSSLDGAAFMACGLPAFVETVRKVLENKGVDLKTRFKAEMFG